MKALITRKTRQSSRFTYTYKSVVDGDDIKIIPGVDGVTEALIASLHKDDDDEVESNLTYLHSYRTDDEKEHIKAWKVEHPGEYCSAEWNISADSLTDDNGKSSADRHEEYSYEQKEICGYTPELERLHEIVDSLPERQKQAYELVYVWEFKENIAAEMMGISPAAVTKLLKKTKEKISSDEILKNYFRGG